MKYPTFPLQGKALWEMPGFHLQGILMFQDTICRVKNPEYRKDAVHILGRPIQKLNAPVQIPPGFGRGFLHWSISFAVQ